MGIKFRNFHHVNRPDTVSRYYHMFVLEFDLVKPGYQMTAEVNTYIGEIKEYLHSISQGGYNVYATPSGIFVWIKDDKPATMFKLRYSPAS